MVWNPSSHPIFVSSKPRHRTKLQIYRRYRKRYEEDDMEVMNLKLCLENRSMIEENEKLRKKARLLHQQNLALMSEILLKSTDQVCRNKCLKPSGSALLKPHPISFLIQSGNCSI